MIHELKTLPPFFQAVLDGDKTFEVRLADRPFKIGDFMHLREWHHGEYIGRDCILKITYILEGGQFGIQQGYSVIGFKSILG